MPTHPPRKSRNNKDAHKTFEQTIPKLEVRKSQLTLGSNYDENMLESLLEYIDNLLSGKLGAPSGFLITIEELSIVKPSGGNEEK
jgi:hypothetical protein